MEEVEEAESYEMEVGIEPCVLVAVGNSIAPMRSSGSRGETMKMVESQHVNNSGWVVSILV